MDRQKDLEMKMRCHLWNTGHLMAPRSQKHYQVFSPHPGKDLQTGKTIGGGHEKGGIYFLSNPVVIAASSVTSLSSSFQWHLRLGHPSVSKLRHLLPHLSVPESFNLGTDLFHTYVNEPEVLMLVRGFS
ncbi:hypothetical protein EJ110_NYTH49123 [Nymphaea thermarum]|nr:hypothetical protein EJ110_NYTH49123 [Nymphaea thermarum]